MRSPWYVVAANGHAIEGAKTCRRPVKTWMISSGCLTLDPHGSKQSTGQPELMDVVWIVLGLLVAVALLAFVRGERDST